jgi:hypothetical protein
MYWFKRSLTPNPSLKERGLIAIGFIILISLFSSCKPDVKETKGTLTFFDIKGYFKADSARLSKTGMITKSVMHNGATETKKVHIDNWGREFELFSNSDINRPAWRSSYRVSNGKDLTVYEALLPDLKTRRILIGKKDDKVKWILIYNHTKNLLYENVEKLTYFPDSIYQIDKSQKVRLLGKNLYMIKGSFN